MVEVEFKFCVESILTVRTEILKLGATESLVCEEWDEYFNHPLHDFVEKDLALRIRKVAGSSWLTFKGPNRDGEAKIREEIEISLDASEENDDADKMRRIWLACGFVSAATVEKRRVKYDLVWQHTKIQICLDSVTGLGDFVELEVVVEDEPGLIMAAKGQLAELAERLELRNSTTKSYLAMLAEVKQQP